jgi:hypothetical protein
MGINKHCLNCGTEFTVRNYRKDTAKYCSKKCLHTSEIRISITASKLMGRCVNPKTTFKAGHKHSEEVRMRMSGKRPNANPWNKKPDVFIVCANCGIEKKIKPAYEGKAKCCSKKCSDSHKDQGKTSEQKKIRTSNQYAEWRKAVFERDGYTCVECGIKGGKLNADHIKRFVDFPELRFDVSNGRTMCEPCHRKTPTYGNRPKGKIKQL